MELVLDIINIIGIISFAAAGAMIAIDKETDVVGVVLMAITTCFAGGMLRDVLAGNLIGLDCPWFFSGSPDANLYIIISVSTAVIVFLAALIFKKSYVREEKLVRAVNNVLDAIGIGVFAVIFVFNACNRSHGSVYSLCCLTHSFIGSMRIYVERGLHRFVSNGTRQGFNIHSISEHLRCESMAESVEWHVLTFCLFKYV